MLICIRKQSWNLFQRWNCLQKQSVHTFTCPCAQVIDLDGKERENKESVQALLLMLDKSLLPTQALHGLVSLNSALEWCLKAWWSASIVAVPCKHNMHN